MARKIYVVTLTLFVDHDEYPHPDDWSWHDLLDMPHNDVILEDVREVGNGNPETVYPSTQSEHHGH